LESQELDFSSDSEGKDSDDNMDNSDSSFDSATSSSSESPFDGDDSDFMTPAESYIHHMSNLYSENYMVATGMFIKSECIETLIATCGEFFIWDEMNFTIRVELSFWN
jgi:hypothetical protein